MRRIFGLLAALALSAFAGAAAAAPPNWPATLTIGSASPGGTYFVYGEALARMLTRELGIPVYARATEGPAQNIQLLEKGDVQVAFVTLGVALQGWNGQLPGDATPHREMRALFPMYDTPFQFVVMADAPAKTIADLSARRIGVGPQGGTTAVYAAPMLKALKIEGDLRFGDWANLAQQLQDGALDGLLVGAGAPFPAFLTLEKRGRLRFLPIGAAQQADLRLAMPELGPAAVPPGLYASLPQRYVTVGLYNFAVGRPDLPDSLVYAILDAVFANNDELSAANPAATETIPSNVTRNTFLPFHNGAGRWYRANATRGVEQGD